MESMTRQYIGKETSLKSSQARLELPLCENSPRCSEHTDRSALESVAMKAAMVIPALLLQKPHPRSIAKDHVIIFGASFTTMGKWKTEGAFWMKDA